MQLKGKINFKKLIPPPLRWRLGLAALALLSVIFVIEIWMSGAGETDAAIFTGRRLIVRLDDGTIEGKLIKAEDLENGTPPPPIAAIKPGAPPPIHDNTLPVPQDTTPPKPVTLDTSGPALPVTNTPADPISSLSEEAKDGLLPVIAQDGTKPWRYYAKPYERKGGQPMIAIIVTGLGESREATEAATRLPEDVTLSFSPYAKDLKSWLTASHATGHEVLLDLPMEPADYPASDPGPDALLTTNSPDLNIAHLNWIMSRMQAYIGLLTPQNEAFSNNGDDYKLLLQSLANRGLLLVIGHEPAKNETKEIVDTTPTANITADVLLDEDLSASVIDTRLAALEELAKRRGYAIGVAQPYALTIDQLRSWADTLDKKGLVLVPVSAVAKLRFS